MAYLITLACVDVMDRSCIDECPVDCIYEGTRMLYIHAEECVDCGACEPVCPVEAIYYDDDLPAEMTQFRAFTAEFFAGLGLPGGAQALAPRADPAGVTTLTSAQTS
jgi:NAD-dependent dihydropyrimidine dehydrogenase PreA subunit